MSSSTSSSDAVPAARGRAVRIVLLLVAALALLEGVTRELLVPASKDLSRFETYGARARQLVAAPVPRVALIGNSTAERGVLLDLLREEWLPRTGHPLSVDMFVADGSGVNTWYWIVAHDFWNRGLKPDLFVVIYYGSGLTDSSVMEVGRIARYFSDADDRSALFAHDFITLEQRVDFLLSSMSQAWAARDRIRERTLKLIPGYEAFATQTNAINFQHERRRESGAVAPKHTYRAFHRFVDRARQEGVPVVFVAFPSRAKEHGAIPYELSPEALREIADAGMQHLDLRRVAGLSPAMYADDIHLNGEGQLVFTRELAEQIVKVWPSR